LTGLPDRLQAVLAPIYLIYNAGADAAASPAGDGLRAEAIRLARILTSLMADEPEATGLLALPLLTESRFRSRVTGWRAGTPSRLEIAHPRHRPESLTRQRFPPLSRSLPAPNDQTRRPSSIYVFRSK
jgi:predicted RNA polymerase sigma factor